MSDAHETETPAPKNRGGRPRKSLKGERRSTLTFRVRGEMHARLKRAAEASERSISEEVEGIVARHFEAAEQAAKDGTEPAHNIGELVKQSLRLAAMSTGAEFHESGKGYEAAVSAIINVVAMMKRPEGYDAKSSLKALGAALGPAAPDKLEAERAQAIGWAAAVQAVHMRRGQRERGEAWEVLLSGGEVLEPGYDRDALRRYIERDAAE